MRISDWSSDVCSSDLSSPLDWSMTFEFRAQTLKRFNPMPYLLQLLLEVHGLRAQSGALYSVLSRSEEHTSELQSLMRISYAVFCLKKKNKQMEISEPTQQQQHNDT